MSSLVAFRVDAGHEIGTGHLVRCLTLAEQLAARGARCIFVSARMPRRLAARISAANHEHLEMASMGTTDQDTDAAAFLDALSGRVDVIVVDHYELDGRWEEQVADRARKVLVVDDLADRPHIGDVLLDQNWMGPRTAERYRDFGGSRLLGPRYALLQPEYARLRAQGTGLGGGTPGARRRVVVSFGGSDPTGETELVVRAARDLGVDAPHLDVVVGGAVASGDRLEALAAGMPAVTLHRDLPTLAPLLFGADLALGAGGASTWERLCLRVPAVAVTVADNQVAATRALSEAGLVEWMGHAGQLGVETYRQRLLEPPPPTPPDLVDGRGALRVAHELLPHAGRSLALRPARRGDAPALTGPAAPDAEETYLEGPVAWQRWGDRVSDGPAWVLSADDVVVGAVVTTLDGPVWWLDPGAAEHAPEAEQLVGELPGGRAARRRA